MKLEIIKELNMEEYSWCNSAVLTELSDGKGVLTSVKTDYDEVGNTPFVQGLSYERS